MPYINVEIRTGFVQISRDVHVTPVVCYEIHTIGETLPLLTDAQRRQIADYIKGQWEKWANTVDLTK